MAKVLSMVIFLKHSPKSNTCLLSYWGAPNLVLSAVCHITIRVLSRDLHVNTTKCLDYSQQTICLAETEGKSSTSSGLESLRRRAGDASVSKGPFHFLQLDEDQEPLPAIPIPSGPRTPLGYTLR